MAGTKKTRAQLVSADNTLIPSGVPDGVIAINHRQSNEDAYTSNVNKLDDKVESQTDLSARTRLGATEDFNHEEGDGKTFVTYEEAQALAGGGTVTSVNGILPVAGNVAIDTSSDLGTSYFTDKVGITNTNGDGTEILAVGVMNAGVMIPTDKAKIDKYPDTATNGKILQGNGSTYVEVDPTSGATNLSVTNRTATTLDVASDTGTDATLPSANATEAGLMIAVDKVKLDKYPTTATNGKILQGNGTTYVEVDPPSGGGILEPTIDGAYLRQKAGVVFSWVEGVLKSTYDAFVVATNNALATKENKINTYQSVSSVAGVLTLDYNTSKNWTTQLTENVTSMVINNLPAGGEMNLRLIQNATAPYYTVALPASSKVSNYGQGVILMSNFNSAVDFIAFKKVGADLYVDHFAAYN